MDPETLDQTTMDVDEPSDGQDVFSYVFMSTQNPHALKQSIALMEKEERRDGEPSSPQLDRRLASVLGTTRSSRPHTQRPFRRRGSSQIVHNKNSQSAPFSSADIFKAFQPAVMEQVTDIAKRSAMRRSSGQDGDASMNLDTPLTGNAGLDSRPGSSSGSGKRKALIEGGVEKRRRVPPISSSNKSDIFGLWQPSATSSTSERQKGKMRALDPDHHPFSRGPAHCGSEEIASEPFLSPQPPTRPLKRQSTLPTLPDVTTNSNFGSASTSFTSSSSLLNLSVTDESDSSHDTSVTSYSMEADGNCSDTVPINLAHGTTPSHPQLSFDGYTRRGAKDTLSHSRSVPTVFSTGAVASNSTKSIRSARSNDFGKGNVLVDNMRQSVTLNPMQAESSASTERPHPLLLEQEQKRPERHKEKVRQQVSASQQASSTVTSRQCIAPLTSTPSIPPKTQAPSSTQSTGKYLGMRRPNNLSGKGNSTSCGHSGTSTNKGGFGRSKSDQSPLRDVNGLPTRQKAFKTPFKNAAQGSGTNKPSSSSTGTKAGTQVTRALSSFSLDAECGHKHNPPHGQISEQRVVQNRGTKLRDQSSTSRGRPQDVCMMDMDDDDHATKDADSSFDISFGMDEDEVEAVMRQYDA